VRFFDKAKKCFLKNLVIMGAAKGPFLAELCQSKTAVRTGKTLFGRTGKLIVRWLDGQQIAKQLIYRDMTLDRDVLLDGTLLADVHFRTHSIGDLRQVNRRIVLITNLTLHNQLAF
jgi:hypothetical protein